MDFGSVHIPTVIVAVLLIVGLFVVGKWVLKKV